MVSLGGPQRIHRRELLVRFHFDVVARNQTLLPVQFGPIPIRVIFHIQDLKKETIRGSIREAKSNLNCYLDQCREYSANEILLRAQHEVIALRRDLHPLKIFTPSTAAN